MSTDTRRRATVSTLLRVTATEARLLTREPVAVSVGILLPTALLLGLGALPTLREPSPEFGGLRFVDTWAPMALILGMGILCVQHLPTTLAAYRERGVLRRMSTTPMHPGTLLSAQIIVVSAAAAVSAALLVLSSWLVLDVEPPSRPLLFTAAFAVGAASLIALGVLIAAVAPSAGAANGLSMTLYMLLLLLGGVFLPQNALPDLLVRAGEFAPPGARLLLESWSGGAGDAGLPQLAQLAIMAGIAVAAAALAARLFRWE
ncbi:ABC transporter permease [Nocardiopsis dassonvillei]|uniref:ABC transporter permease n=1 Tax=Nocardiopsis dassonvillei TaxID=2014 RepID=UPI0008FCD708|nr:ABC transporter permease [Nocardiopsis dassonvillei]APC33597.1 ABC transporter [Nocardiopsis dassonvillei]